jgi:cobalamin biosynthesis Mg chelatase CobN
VTESELIVDVQAQSAGAGRMLTGSSAWDVYFEVVADEQTAQQHLNATQGLASNANGETATALADAFEADGLQLEVDSVVVEEPEIKIVTATRTTATSTATSATITELTSTVTSSSRTTVTSTATSQTITTSATSTTTAAATSATASIATSTTATVTDRTNVPLQTVGTSVATGSTMAAAFPDISTTDAQPIFEESKDSSAESLIIIIGSLAALGLFLVGGYFVVRRLRSNRAGEESNFVPPPDSEDFTVDMDIDDAAHRRRMDENGNLVASV